MYSVFTAYVLMWQEENIFMRIFNLNEDLNRLNFSVTLQGFTIKQYKRIK